jgi:hypothetical protein
MTVQEATTTDCRHQLPASWCAICIYGPGDGVRLAASRHGYYEPPRRYIEELDSLTVRLQTPQLAATYDVVLCPKGDWPPSSIPTGAITATRRLSPAVTWHTAATSLTSRDAAWDSTTDDYHLSTNDDNARTQWHAWMREV